MRPGGTPASVLMIAPAVFAFGLVAFGFLGMGPVTIAVDSYGPVTDNAQSVFELSVIESLPNIKQELKKDYGFDVNFERAKHLLEENDGAGNTFKATAKPVLIGTAVVGATTMIFSIIVVLTNGLQPQNLQNLSILHPPFLLGLITGGAMIYWFTGASIAGGDDRRLPRGRVHQGEHQARRASRRPRWPTRRRSSRSAPSTRRRGCSTSSWRCSSRTLGFAFLEPYFFIGYLISIALFGLYQAIFMANAGGAWDNAKKIVEVELKQKGTPLHAATVVGDTVGDPFKDTSSVALEPDHQVHDAVRAAGGGTGCAVDQGLRGRDEPCAGGGVRARVDDFRVPVVLRDADQGRRLKLARKNGVSEAASHIRKTGV